ncbi:outer membrane protein [Hoeflea sp. AS16]|uniref:outer membrane protein n=1 Tax=unclassified Hoeflea TaxID=2614931 RepID=UPI00316F5164
MIMRFAAASSIAALMGIAAPAHAADLDEIIYAKELPVTKSVEIGSGWYLRGDLGYSAKTRGVATNYQVFTAGTPGTYTSTPFNSSSLNDDVSGSVGVGYNFTDYFRGDLTFDFSKGRFFGSRSSTLNCPGVASGQCAGEDVQNFEHFGFMANAYVDLGTFVGFTPYVGAGVGFTRLTWESYNSDLSCVSVAGNACGIGGITASVGAGNQSWRFTYALMGGVSYDLTQDLKLDLGYKYSKIESGNQAGFDATAILAGASGYQIQDNGFQKHEVRVGLRYNLW